MAASGHRCWKPGLDDFVIHATKLIAPLLVDSLARFFTANSSSPQTRASGGILAAVAGILLGFAAALVIVQHSLMSRPVRIAARKRKSVFLRGGNGRQSLARVHLDDFPRDSFCCCKISRANSGIFQIGDETRSTAIPKP